MRSFRTFFFPFSVPSPTPSLGSQVRIVCGLTRRWIKALVPSTATVVEALESQRVHGLLIVNKESVSPAPRWQKFGALEQSD